MTRHPTPDPIDAHLTLHRANLRLIASDVDQTIVEVRPTDADDPSDVWAAEHTTVELTDDRLTLRAPDQRRPADRESIDVAVGLPSGSSVEVDGDAVRLSATGRLGRCRIGVAAGQIDLDRVAEASLTSGSAAITVARCDGALDLDVASGPVAVGHLAGPAVVATTSGSVSVGEADDDLRVVTTSGRIQVARAAGPAELRSTSGAVELGRVGDGPARAETTTGAIVVGAGLHTVVATSTTTGTVRDRGAIGARSGAEITATTRTGDITVHRSDP